MLRTMGLTITRSFESGTNSKRESKCNGHGTWLTFFLYWQTTNHWETGQCGGQPHHCYLGHYRSRRVLAPWNLNEFHSSPLHVSDVKGLTTMRADFVVRVLQCRWFVQL